MANNLVYETSTYQDESFIWYGSLKLYSIYNLESPIKEYNCVYKWNGGSLKYDTGDNLDWLVDGLISNKFLEMSVYKKSKYVNKFLMDIMELNEKARV